MDIEDIKKRIQREKKNIKRHKIKGPGERVSKISYYEWRIRYFQSVNDREKLINEILLAYYELSRTTFWQLKMDLKDIPEVDEIIREYIKKK